MMEKERPQIYLFYGEEDFLADEKVREIGSRAANIELIDGDNISLETLSNALCGYSLFAGEKQVVVRDLPVSAGNQEAVISLLKNVPPGTTVIFRSSSADKRSKFYKWVDTHGETREFRSFAPWEQRELLGWVKSRARISDAGARVLLEICGNNLRLLASEIEKLLTFVGGRGEIGEKDVLALASPGETSAFALLDALRQKDIGRSLSLFQVLRRDGEDLFQLLSLVVTQYRLMLQIKSLPEREREANSAARRIKGSPYFIRKCSDNLDHFSVQELKDDMKLLLEANLRLKTGEAQPIVFELLLASLCKN